MDLLLAAAGHLGRVNATLLTIGRWLGGACLGVMVIVILVQVLFRYGLGNALPWTEEFSRFLMLWMTGLMAPTAFRRGGFVSIELVVSVLPRLPAAILNLVLLLISAVVLWWGLRIGWNEVTGLGGRFTMPSLSIPVSLDLAQWMKVPRSWMMASLATGVTVMFAVNVELILRCVASLFGAASRLLPIPMSTTLGAE
ncbi:TRAP transporter small permease [Sinorhizobium arboris]|uniref:TRAP transporter small permease n=1 Tax=Sinorhizobium arboris TaxID=76745 RepID=UPI0003F822AE|nr:TRAP transporter small permease subunit [Sinorhizobium arboris]